MKSFYPTQLVNVISKSIWIVPALVKAPDCQHEQRESRLWISSSCAVLSFMHQTNQDNAKFSCAHLPQFSVSNHKKPLYTPSTLSEDLTDDWKETKCSEGGGL